MQHTTIVISSLSPKNLMFKNLKIILSKANQNQKSSQHKKGPNSPKINKCKGTSKTHNTRPDKITLFYRRARVRNTRALKNSIPAGVWAKHNVISKSLRDGLLAWKVLGHRHFQRPLATLDLLIEDDRVALVTIILSILLTRRRIDLVELQTGSRLAGRGGAKKLKLG